MQTLRVACPFGAPGAPTVAAMASDAGGWPAERPASGGRAAAKQVAASRVAAGRGAAGQATVEWVGLVLVVALALAGTAALVTGAIPGASLAHSLAERLLCAARITGECDPDR